MLIHLCDKNRGLVTAWEKEFNKYPDVKVYCDDIFNIKADAIISPANSFGFMDGGIDLAYSKYFGGDLEKRLQVKIKSEYNGELPVGMATSVETGHAVFKYLISCPTMRVPESVSKTVNAYLAFRAGLIEFKRLNIQSVVCPGLGTLTGGIRPAVCATQMRFAYDNIVGRSTFVFGFPQSLDDAFYEHICMTRIKSGVR